MNEIKVITKQTIDKERILDIAKRSFSYQEELTDKLDDYYSEPIDFNQSILNEIVLWKVNRYVSFSADTIYYLNKIDSEYSKLDEDFTSNILTLLLNQKGIRLPMASTILRFKNPKIYQIIDQRVYRIIKGESYSSYFNKDSKSSIKNQINIYIEYLDLLRQKCQELNIPFETSDRVLYEADKILNKNVKIKY